MCAMQCNLMQWTWARTHRTRPRVGARLTGAASAAGRRAARRPRRQTTRGRGRLLRGPRLETYGGARQNPPLVAAGEKWQ